MFSLLAQAPAKIPHAATNSSLASTSTSTSTNPKPSTISSFPSSSLSSSKTAAQQGGFASTTLFPLSSSATAALTNIHSQVARTGRLVRQNAPKNKRIHILVVFLHALLVSALVYSGRNAKEVHKARLLLGFECPVEDYLRTECEGAKDCLYRIEGRCAEFVECRWSNPIKPNLLVSASSPGTARAHTDLANLRVEAVTMSCPVYHDAPIWEWNDIRKRCDYPGTKGTCSWVGDGEDDTWKPMDETPHLGLVIKWIVEELRLFWPRRVLSWA